MSSSHAALIVDADPKGLESLVYGFEGADWRITACPAPETASLLLKASGAAIGVIASRVEHERAYTLIRQIRAKEAFHTLPLLVLGPEELRKPLKAIGDVDLLPLPAFVRDVLTASQLLVEAGVAAAQRPGEEPCFAPRIATMTTLSLIRTMCGLARSGTLELERKGRHGEILFHEGELTAAQVSQLQGMAAVQHVLIWNDGALRLHLRPVARRGQFHQTTPEFIEELDRFRRDYAHAMIAIGLPATVYSISEERLLRSSNAVPAEVSPVVRLCNGQRTLLDIIDESPFRVLDTVRILARLDELAILVRRDPKPDESATKAARPPMEEFWETARIVGPSAPHATRARQGLQGLQGLMDANDAAVPQPIAPATTPPQSARSEVRRRSNAHGEAAVHSRKKTLEIPTTVGHTPELETPLAVPVPASGAAPAAATLTQSGQGLITSPLTTSSLTDAPVDPSVSTAPKVTVPRTHASGIIERYAQRTPSTARTVRAHTSVVVDTAQIEVVRVPPATALTPEIQSPIVRGPAFSSPVVQSPTVQSPVAQVSTVTSPVADARQASAVAKITGEFQAAPSRKTARQMPVQARMSVQLDATLMPEPKAATAPAQSTDGPKIEASPMRLTGEIQVAPSARHARSATKPERTTSSFHIDPSLTAPSLTAEKPMSAETPQPYDTDNRPVALSSDKRHQSGNFSPIEKDFFEREAELYKVENTESFADLEEKRAKAAGKSDMSKKPDRRRRK